MPAPSKPLGHARLPSVQPATGEAGAEQTGAGVRVAPHEAPDQPRPIVLDHQEDWPLIDAEIVTVEPSRVRDHSAVLHAAAESVGRVERVEKTVFGEEPVAVKPSHAL